MAKKNIEFILPAQIGFGFEVCDIDGRTPGFLFEKDDVVKALHLISLSDWVSLDVETTGLTDASLPVSLGRQAIKEGAFNQLRMRTIQARVPTVNGRSGPRMNYAFDCDKLSLSLLKEVTQTILSRKMFIAHNAGFDLYWLRLANERQVMPKMVVDTMLLTRLMQPELVLKRAELLMGVRSSADLASQPLDVQAAWKSHVSGASGSSLADVVLAMFGVVVDKTYQKPGNWTGLLGFEHYDYAIDDVVWADKILAQLLGTPEEGDPYRAYLHLRARESRVRLIEPQVPELVLMREHGMPISTDVGNSYVKKQRKVLANKVEELIDLEPLLAPHFANLADPDAGLDDALKKSLATAFENRGVVLRKTAATSAAQVGEKDLRACRAAQIEEARPLFNAWVAVCRAKKSSNMAADVVGYANRSPKGRIRSLVSHGPVTGRLSAAEPNVQQWARDQLFRAMCISDCVPGKETLTLEVTETNRVFLSTVLDKGVSVGETVTVPAPWLAAMFAADKYVPEWPSQERTALAVAIDACFTDYIVASDFGALDVRVGAALCVRSQREMLKLAQGHAVPGPVQPREGVVSVIRKVFACSAQPDPASALAELEALFKGKAQAQERLLEALKIQLDKGDIQRNTYFKRRSEAKDSLLEAKLGWRFAQCRGKALARGEEDYSALRDAFVVGVDIHTFTGMKLVGRDPMSEFEGLTSDERKALEKKLKKELGPRRQQGKIANLSLLYGMADAGFQEAAARGYDEHWTLQEAGDIRALWMNAYPEVELWHLWTESLQAGTVYIPEMGKEKPVRTGWWMARTLAGRDIVAFGLNAALSYQDQSTGADILALIMHKLHDEYPHIFQYTINQVHDELCFSWPQEMHETYLPVVEDVMVGCANSLTMPYGVPCAVSPASGPLWIKD